MFAVSIIIRKLKEGKTYEDFRKAWYHTVGFGMPCQFYTMINAFDPREIIVIAIAETNPDEMLEKVRLDVKERLANPLDDIIEPEIVRKFGQLVAEDDFSNMGKIEYSSPRVAREKTDMELVQKNLLSIVSAITQGSKERDEARAGKTK